ncbi:MAG: hypothetical protein HC906_03965 [Bacteroidales bacterium]|nr:hypothetical protein [Bacteroidales bacterium]
MNKCKKPIIRTGLLAVLFIFFFSSVLFSQTTSEDIDTIKHHSPRNAVIMSALVPGLGQVYNNKIWKVPLLYGGFGATFYYYNFTRNGT